MTGDPAEDFLAALDKMTPAMTPRERYETLTGEFEACTALVTALRRHRGKALEEWVAAAGSQGAVAEELGLSRQRIGQIIEWGYR
jgi:hypothetical protein